MRPSRRTRGEWNEGELDELVKKLPSEVVGIIFSNRMSLMNPLEVCKALQAWCRTNGALSNICKDSNGDRFFYTLVHEVFGLPKIDEPSFFGLRGVAREPMRTRIDDNGAYVYPEAQAWYEAEYKVDPHRSPVMWKDVWLLLCTDVDGFFNGRRGETAYKSVVLNAVGPNASNKMSVHFSYALAGTQTEWHGPETDNVLLLPRNRRRPIVTVGDQMGPYLVRLLQIKRAYLPYGVELLTLTRLFQIKNVFKQNAFALEEDTFEATLSQLLRFRLQSPVHSFLSMRNPNRSYWNEMKPINLLLPSPGLMPERADLTLLHWFLYYATGPEWHLQGWRYTFPSPDSELSLIAPTRWLLDMGVDPNAVCTVLRQKDNSGFAEIEYLGNTDDGFERLRDRLVLEEVSQLGLRADYKCTALGMFFFHFTKTMVLTNRTQRSVGLGTDPKKHVPMSDKNAEYAKYLISKSDPGVGSPSAIEHMMIARHMSFVKGMDRVDLIPRYESLFRDAMSRTSSEMLKLMVVKARRYGLLWSQKEIEKELDNRVVAQ